MLWTTTFIVYDEEYKAVRQYEIITAATFSAVTSGNSFPCVHYLQLENPSMPALCMIQCFFAKGPSDSLRH